MEGHKISCECENCKVVKVLLKTDSQNFQKIILAAMLMVADGNDDAVIGMLEKMKTNLLLNNMNAMEFMKSVKLDIEKRKKTG